MSTKKTSVWILPKSRKLLVDGYGGGVPVEACNWDKKTKDFVKSLGLTGALYEFDEWNKATSFANIFCNKNEGWDYDCQSPMGDLAAAIASDEF